MGQCNPEHLSEKVPATSRLTLISGACNIPHPDKMEKGGEDAFFTIPNAVGVFDGVGGTLILGTDSGIFAKQLAENVKRRIQSRKLPSFLKCVTNGLKEVNVDGNSTVCVAAIRRDILTTINVGDSCVMIVRDGRVVYCSLIQTHFFNCPFQVSDNKSDSDVEHAVVDEFPIFPRDILVMGTDGLWDNMYTYDILDILAQFPYPIGPISSTELAQLTLEISSFLAQKARQAAASSTKTPFADACMTEGHHFVGGKMDDITVIVGIVAADSS